MDLRFCRISSTDVNTIQISPSLLSLSSSSPPPPLDVRSLCILHLEGIEPKFRPGETLAEFSVKPPSSENHFLRENRRCFPRGSSVACVLVGEKVRRTVRKNISVFRVSKNFTSREEKYREGIRERLSRWRTAGIIALIS